MGTTIGVTRGDTRSVDYGSYGAFPKLGMNTSVGVPTIRIMIFLGLYWAPRPVLKHCHMKFSQICLFLGTLQKGSYYQGKCIQFYTFTILYYTLPNSKTATIQSDDIKAGCPEPNPQTPNSKPLNRKRPKPLNLNAKMQSDDLKSRCGSCASICSVQAYERY